MPLPADTGRIWAAVPPFGRNAYSGHRFARDEKKSRKNKNAAFPRSAAHYLGPLSATGWGSDFTHPWVWQAERLACRERQPAQFPGGSPDPLYLQRKKMLRCLYTPRKEIPPCCPCAALCETIGYRAPVVPANQDVAAEGPLQAKDETRKRMSKGLPYFPFQRRIFSL